MNYYNEFDPQAAQWLRKLIEKGLIPDGFVDERSIADVQPGDLAGYTQCHFFAGIGGWSEALRLAGWPADRDVWTGSCPCQPFSVAGKGKGEEDKRHLWPEFRRLIAECNPPVVFGEQVAAKAGRKWLAGVRSDLEVMGYGVGAADLCAPGAGAPHIRQRLFWLAQPEHTIGRPEHKEHSQAYGRDGSGGSSEPCRLGDSVRSRRPEGRPESGNGQASGPGPTMRLDDSNDAGPQGRREHAGEHADQRSIGAAGEFGRLGEPDGAGRESRGSSGASVGHGGTAEPASSASGMGHSAGDDERRQREPGSSSRRDGEVRGSGAWSDFDIVHCTDGRARRIEPGTFPLVAKLSKGMVRSSDPGAPINALASAEARIVRLRGYGNSIVPAIAAEFVMAFMGEL